MSQSPRGKLSTADLKKVGVGAGIAAAGAAMAFITDALPGVELGEAKPYVMLGWQVLANLVRKWITDHQTQEG